MPENKQEKTQDSVKTPLDIPKLMAEIRERVKKDIGDHPALKTVRRFSADPGSRTQYKAGAVQFSEELNYLNSNWQYPNALKVQPVVTHRKGFIGKIIVTIKQKLLAVIYEGLFKQYVDAEQQFQMRIVQILNLIAKYTDERDAATFWELNRKIDYDVSKATERSAEQFDDLMGELRTSEKQLSSQFNQSATFMTERLTKLQAHVEEDRSKVATLDSVTKGLESILGRLSKTNTVHHSSEITVSELPDYTYLLLENRFRGSTDEIRKRLSVYTEFFKDAKGPVLDLGAGRGELVLLLNQSGIDAYGIDPDTGMLDEAKAHGADVRKEEGIAHLNRLADGSLGGLIAIQVVEHLDKKTLTNLFQLASKKVAKGGRVIFETINPQSVLALSSNYFRDPTHVFPLHPDTLSYALTLAGFTVEEVKYLSPVPAEATLKTIEKDEFMTPRWAFAVDKINHNIEQLNRLLYGYQDFAVIARVN